MIDKIYGLVKPDSRFEKKDIDNLRNGFKNLNMNGKTFVEMHVTKMCGLLSSFGIHVETVASFATVMDRNNTKGFNKNDTYNVPFINEGEYLYNTIVKKAIEESSIQAN
eukprot:320314_1